MQNKVEFESEKASRTSLIQSSRILARTLAVPNYLNVKNEENVDLSLEMTQFAPPKLNTPTSEITRFVCVRSTIPWIINCHHWRNRCPYLFHHSHTMQIRTPLLQIVVLRNYPFCYSKTPSNLFIFSVKFLKNRSIYQSEEEMMWRYREDEVDVGRNNQKCFKLMKLSVWKLAEDRWHCLTYSCESE